MSDIEHKLRNFERRIKELEKQKHEHSELFILNIVKKVLDKISEYKKKSEEEIEELMKELGVIE